MKIEKSKAKNIKTYNRSIYKNISSNHRNLYNKSILAIWLCLMAFFFTSCNLKSKEPLSKTGIMLNTYVTITLYDHQDIGLLEECFELCREYETMLSRTMEGSEVSNFNQAEAGEYEVSKEVYELLTISMEYSKRTDGAFDVTIEPVSSLWNFTAENPLVPDENLIAGELENVGFSNLKLEEGKVTKTKKETGIDFGAIAKGYIADKIKEHLLANGVESAMIDLGGNILLVGEKPDGSGFQVGIQKPFEDRKEIIGRVSLKDYAAVSSGIYERCFTKDGIFYHHILDPKTGYPCESDLLAVTILAPDATRADALSTSCFILGKENGKELLDSMEGVYGIFITKEGEVEYSEGFIENFGELKTK